MNIRSSDFDGFWCICTVREVHIARSVRSRIFGFWGLEKSENFCEKMIFAKITCFFVGSFWVEILRLAHSFGLSGCLGCSKHRQFHKNQLNSWIWQGYCTSLRVFCSAGWEAPQKVRRLNIWDERAVCPQTGCKMTTLCLCIEQKLSECFFSLKKYFSMFFSNVHAKTKRFWRLYGYLV